ncbi:unnamed protein product [Camellia sinensis]
MSFNDDEPIVASQDVSGKKPAAILAGKKTKVAIFNKTTAPLEESEFKVMLELTGAGSGSDRSGVDIVTVLDVSRSMEGEKLEKMKIAMLFMIKKLSPIDRLSVVKFNQVSHRLCPLRQIIENSQREIENLVNALIANGYTNISAGLETGLKVLNDRRFISGRAVGIMLMSDGQQNIDGDAAQVPVGNVPVYTFGFGADHDPRVLNSIANNSLGGTFSHVRNQDSLSIAFSQCLAGLLTVVVQDLKLTVTKVESTIVKVSAGNYPQSKDDAAGSMTVSFGYLYNKEVRKVIVDLLLPAASSPATSNILNITYTYSSGGKLFDESPIIVTVRRTGGGREGGEPETKEVMMEENRLRTAQMIKESRIMADDKKLDGALEKLVEAQSLQENMVNDESNPLIGMLKSELRQMSKLMKPQEIYEKQGRPFALSSETSHDRQRFAARGDDPKELRLFATPRMDEYLEQAKSFDEDPRKPLPSVDEDEKEELEDEPLPPMVGGEIPATILRGKTNVTIIKKTTAPLEESEFKVMLELTGAGFGSDRSGVDLVTVLDVSGSMEGEKLEKMKIAMLFMIKKLSPIDRLSVVTFNGVSHKLCPLRPITKNSQGEIENLINALVANGGTNISAGLQTGLKVLNERRLTSGRVVGIMLMSGSQQNVGGDAAQVPVGNVPIYTFGFGTDHDPRVLNAIANHSMGGTFSDVRNLNNLSIAFSQCLAGLHTVVVRDLKLTVTKVESTILKVSAGNYPLSYDDAAGSVTVSFGDLYNKDVRKVIVDLLLPPASSLAGSNVLNITYTYSSGGKLFDARPIIITVSRTGRTSVEPERKEVMMEENRLRTAQMIKASRVMADDKNLDGALENLVEAQSLQENVVNDESNPLIGMLKSELQQMSRLMKPQAIYEKQGRPFALSSETSHNRQRFAARGDDPKELRLFATPRMDAYLEQAKSFGEDPRKPLPSVDEDEKQERAAEPLPPMVRGLRYYIQNFFNGFLKCCGKICVSDSSPQDR